MHTLAVDLLFGLVEHVQHLLYDGLEGPTQVHSTIRLLYGRHVDECGVPMAQVQRGVVGEVTEVSVRKDTGINIMVLSGGSTVRYVGGKK